MIPNILCYKMHYRSVESMVEEEFSDNDSEKIKLKLSWHNLSYTIRTKYNSQEKKTLDVKEK